MIVNFVGAPCSGKTTTAASLFAKLKEDGHPAEFLTEQARLYIASIRLTENLQPSDPVSLSDFDQAGIMYYQMHYETMLQKVCGPDMIVVTDSSFLNALLYMTEEGKTVGYKHSIAEYVAEASKHDRIIFVCPAVKPPAGSDPNRVHSEEQAKLIEAKIPEMLATYAKDAHIVNLEGTTHQRFLTVVSEVFKKLC
jgi:hypothetical protein